MENVGDGKNLDMNCKSDIIEISRVNKNREMRIVGRVFRGSVLKF